MNFTTSVDIPKTSLSITHQQRLMLLGSCFADSIGQKLIREKYQCLVNPFGTLYNPASIAALLLRSISEQEYTAQSPEIFTANNAFSWMHHSSFHAESAEELAIKLNKTMHCVAEWLRNCDVLIVTFGSSYIYRQKETGMLVANCHKQPDTLFQRVRLAAYDIADSWTTLLHLLHSVNPKLQIIFTVSPIRHKRDGMHQNQLSKAELLLAIDQLQMDFTHYFPSYEIQLDELRDYRFYADDMVHPSDLAVQYIYQRFADTYIPKDEQQLAAQCCAVADALQHRPLHTDDKAYNEFLQKTLQRIEQIKAQHPYIDFEDEIILCNTKFQK